MKKKLLLILAIALIATLACSIGQSPTDTKPPEVTVVPFDGKDITPQDCLGCTPSPTPYQIITPTIQIVSPTPRSEFLFPIPDGCHSHNVASSDIALYPIGASGIVYVTTVEKARAGMSIEDVVKYLIYSGLDGGQTIYSMIVFPDREAPGRTEFRFDGGGVAVLGNYYPGKLLDEWYKTADPTLALEIQDLMVLIKANAILLAPASDQSIAFTCPQATP